MIPNSAMQIPVRLLLMGFILMNSVGADDEAHLSSQKCIIDPSNSPTETIYRFSERELNGNRTIRLSQYTGKVSWSFYIITYNIYTIYFNLFNVRWFLLSMLQPTEVTITDNISD